MKRVREGTPKVCRDGSRWWRLCETTGSVFGKRFRTPKVCEEKNSRHTFGVRFICSVVIRWFRKASTTGYLPRIPPGCGFVANH